MALGVFGGEGDQFGGHEVADRTDILFVCNSSEDAVEKFENMCAGEGCAEGCIEGFVGGLI